jgi:hypothetical protein
VGCPVARAPGEEKPPGAQKSDIDRRAPFVSSRELSPLCKEPHGLRSPAAH